jgi:hypothetical protein
MMALTERDKEQIKASLKKIADGIVEIMNVVDGNLEETERFVDKAFEAAKLVYSHPYANPKSDMGFNQSRRGVIDHLATKPGTLAHRFREMMRDSSEEGAMKWMVRNIGDFPKEQHAEIIEGVREFAKENPSFDRWLRSEAVNEAKAAGKDIYTSYLWNMLR